METLKTTEQQNDIFKVLKKAEMNLKYEETDQFFKVFEKRGNRFKIWGNRPERNWVLATDSDFQIAISLQPDGVNLWYFKLSLFDLK